MSEPATLGLAAGELIAGKFRLEALLGSGGYGEVWRARQKAGDTAGWREVALKLMPLAAGSAGEAPELAIGEALAQTRAASAVESDALATVYDVDVDLERPEKLAFLSMELLHGETLEERLRRGPVYFRRALAIARDIARALSACHAARVVHCDLKPQNVFLTDSGRVVVLDFGVAALRTEPGHGAPRSREPRRLRGVDEATEPVSQSAVPGPLAALGGAVVGTNGYIAPERFGGGEPGPAVDVYALGVVLYRCIAGRLPYAGLPPAPPAHDDPKARARYDQALVNATVQGELDPLAQAAPGTPAAVCQLVDRMLRRAPERLPASELGAALERVWRRPHGVPEPPYLGLAAFGPDRAGLLAGREADVEHVAGRLARGERVLVLSGPSGAGKSSLAVAGVAARVDELCADGTDGWRVVTVRPSQAGALVLASAASAPSGRAATAAHAPAAGAVDTGDELVGVLVVVDQLEELLGLPEAERDGVCAAFVALCQAREPVLVGGERLETDRPVRVLGTVRDDLFGEVAQLAGLERIPEKSLYTVRGVDPNAAAEIVAGPARAAGYEVEDVERVAREAGELMRRDPTALPLLQFALTLWWDARDKEQKLLRVADWDALGGIEGALGSVAEELYRELDDPERASLRRVLVALFNVDGTRAAARPASLAAGSERVLGELVRRRLVRRLGDGDEQRLEVVHEALAARWTTLRRWLEASRADRQLWEDLERDAARFATSADGDDLLWRGRRLADAALLAADGDTRPGPAVANFVAAARARERRERWRKRAPVAALLVLLFAAVTIGLVTTRVEQRNTALALEQAEDNARRAADNERHALEMVELAERNAARAAELALQAGQSSDLALARAEEARKKAAEAEAARLELEKAMKDNRACQGAIHRIVGAMTRPEQ
ncbi:MAG: serine/threonine protein kinase [Polyangiaceae bacterium]|nr:serine/threonine protein kinase [Polyangiaceae bacterium]